MCFLFFFVAVNEGSNVCFMFVCACDRMYNMDCMISLYSFYMTETTTRRRSNIGVLCLWFAWNFIWYEWYLKLGRQECQED